MENVIEWNEKEIMSKEYALSVIRHIKSFIRASYYMPNRQAFNGEDDFKAWNIELDGLKEYIISLSKD